MLSPGTRLGPYDIEAPLGSGGAGAVYRARDTRLGRAVAVKVLATTSAVDGDALRDRLQREARAISQLAHPHICTLYDIGVTPDGVSYLVMELIEGETLEQCLARGPLPIAQVLTYATQIAAAIGAAHRAGIVHGDLKPGNVMVTKTGVKLLDFGLATEPSHGMSATSPDQVTRTTLVAPAGAITGTLQYLAPEQIEGQPANERSDMFALGAVVYEMVAGRKAFDGSDSGQRHCRDPPGGSAAAIAQQDGRASGARSAGVRLPREGSGGALAERDAILPASCAGSVVDRSRPSRRPPHVRPGWRGSRARQRCSWLLRSSCWPAST